MQILFSFLKKNIERAFFSLISGVCLTYFLREPVFQFISTGKSLAGRNTAIQLGFAILLFCTLFSILYFLLGKKIDWLLKNYVFSAAIIASFPLVAYSIIGYYSRFVADDFSSATLAVSKGIIGATWDWYINWSGRFTASFFDSLVGYIGPGIMPYITGSVILAWLAALIKLVHRFFSSENGIKRFGFSLLISALILITTFEVTPLLSQSLYWGQGMRSVILPLILATFLVSLINAQIITKKGQSVFLLGILAVVSFVAGGFGETYVVLQTSGYLLWFLFVVIENPPDWKKKLLPILLVGIFSSILAMGITIAAPGNKIRQAYFPPPPDIFNLIKISVTSFLNYFLFILNSPMRLLNIAVLFLASFFAGWHQKSTYQSDKPMVNSNRISNFAHFSFSRTICILIILSLTLMYVCFVPAAYGMSTYPPERTLVIPTFLLSISTACFGVITGKFVSKKKIWTQKTGNFVKPLAWLIFLLLGLYSFRITNKILSVQPDYRHFADVFDRADVMIRQAKAEGKDFVKVPEVHNHFGLSDFGAGTTYWLDEAVNSYYGITVIVNKNLK